MPIAKTTAKSKTSRRLAAAFVLLMGVAAAAASLPFDFIHFGNFTRMTQSGQAGGEVALSRLPQRAGDWGLGATAGLKGEIVQIDGRLLVSPGSDAQGRVQAPQADEQAVLFAGARVQAWADVTVPSDMGPMPFDAFVREQAAARGLSLEQPFVFRVEGRFPHLMWHVVTGEASTPAPGPHGGQSGHGPMMGGGHANHLSGMKVFHAPGATGQLVGVYSGVGLEGVVSHAGERLHLHYVDTGTTVSGHVDRYMVGAGSVLKLPVR